MNNINQGELQLIVENLVNTFKNQTNENPIKIKNLYSYLSKLEYIVVLEPNENDINSNNIYLRPTKYKNDDCLYATLFVDTDVFDQWRNNTSVNYKIIKFDDIYDQVLKYVDRKTNIPLIATIILNWGEESFYHLNLNINDVNQFLSYVLMNNSLSYKHSYIIGTPANINKSFIEKFTEDLKTKNGIISAYYAQIVSPPQDDQNIIESHLPNKSYFTIIYNTAQQPSSYLDYKACLDFQNYYTNLAKEYNVDLLLVHKCSQVGSLVEKKETNVIYNK